MRLAQFRNIGYGFTLVNEEYLEHNPEYIRVSEYIDVEFEPIGYLARIEQEIAQLKAEAEKISDRCDTELDAINKKISKLSELLIDGGDN